MKRLLHLFLVLMLVLCFTSAFAERGVTVKGKKGARAAPSKVLKTAYYALVIGNNDYRQLPKLKTAVNDAREVNRVLSEKYGFKTKLLINATRKDILSTINDFRKKLNETDSFLIYYAGHGEFDKAADKGYWLPVDAAKDDPVDWIMAEDITSNIKRILAKHVLILSDSCYSGSLTRSSSSDLGKKGERNAFLAKMMARSSRTLMASGGNEPVADAGGRGNHSVFASAVLTALQDSDRKTFTAEELFHGRVKEIVAGKSDQVPEYNNIRNSGHEGGDFIFQVAQAGRTEEEETASDAGTTTSDTVVSEKYAASFPGMVFVKGGCFQMGDTFGDGQGDEKPVHEVCVDDFYIGKYEVTVGDFKKFATETGYTTEAEKSGGCAVWNGRKWEYDTSKNWKNTGFSQDDRHPVVCVSWNDATAYTEWQARKTSKSVRLPTEAEWEYAARSGGKSEKYSGGNDLDSVAWYNSNSGNQIHMVGQKRPNGLGIYDMSGNVWEWVADWYDENYYRNSPRDNPQGANSGQYRSLRGGSWLFNSRFVRASYRNGFGPTARGGDFGFRLSRSAQ